ncbi:MAG: hypothetical protein VW579_13735, partial [Verrucomicrobiales bacterium]
WSYGGSHNRPQNEFGVKLCAKGTYLKSFFQPMIWTLVLLVFVSHRAAADQVVITEIMRKPKKADAPQWVELSNLTSTVLDCAQWELKGLNLNYTFADFQPDSPANGFIAPFETWIKTLESLGLGLGLSLSKKITWSLWIKISYR